jgi:cell division septum initiation protein DivIVA
MSGAEDRLTSIRESIVTLDERADQLGVTGAAMDRFEERLRQWQALEKRMAHATAQATQREDVLKALRADVTRMFALAEETADQVRETLAARGELEAGRALLDDLKPQLSEMRTEAERLAEHREALAGEDALIARMEAMLCEVRTNHKVLEEQKEFLDHVVATAGVLRFQSRQAESLIESLEDMWNKTDK